MYFRHLCLTSIDLVEVNPLNPLKMKLIIKRQEKIFILRIKVYSFISLEVLNKVVDNYISYTLKKSSFGGFVEFSNILETTIFKFQNQYQLPIKEVLIFLLSIE